MPASVDNPSTSRRQLPPGRQATPAELDRLLTGGVPGALPAVRAELDRLAGRLEEHFAYEEETLLPALTQSEDNRNHPISISLSWRWASFSERLSRTGSLTSMGVAMFVVVARSGQGVR
jgi:hypothetical protein